MTTQISVAWLEAMLELIDDCPGLTMEQDRWLSQRVKEITTSPELQAELDTTNRQVKILRDALDESQREVEVMKAERVSTSPEGCQILSAGEWVSFPLERANEAVAEGRQIRYLVVATAAQPAPVPTPGCPGSMDHLKQMMEHSAFEGVIQLSDAIANIDELFIAQPAAHASAAHVRNPVGNSVWSGLMDWCKRKGVAPATQDCLFTRVEEAGRKYQGRDCPERKAKTSPAHVHQTDGTKRIKDRTTCCNFNCNQGRDCPERKVKTCPHPVHRTDEA